MTGDLPGGSDASRRPDRSISPTVGVVLLVGIALLLSTVSAGIFLNLGQKQPPAPQVRLALERVDGGVEHELVHRSGDVLTGDQITIRGVNDPDALAGRDFQSGDSVTVYPADGTVTVVWTSEDGQDSDVVQRFEVDGPTVEADEGCGWVEDAEAAGGDIVVDGIVVACDVVTDEDVVVKNDGAVVGRVVSTGGQVTIQNDGSTYESVRAEDKVDMDGGIVRGPVTSETGPVDVDDGIVRGDVSADGDVSLPENATIEGSVTSASGDIYVKDGTTVEGSVTAESGNVDVDGGSVVGGHVYVSGSFSCSGGSTVNGQSCGSYTPRSP